eukprot:2950655-Pyramimonas_sp.AAC.1
MSVSSSPTRKQRVTGELASPLLAHRYDAAASALWVLDWGSFIMIPTHERLDMCRCASALRSSLEGLADG